jgi:hypothetical protein
MKLFLASIASSLVLMAGANAEIMCTQHGGCHETGGRIIAGDGGGVNSAQYLNSYRNGKKERVRIMRTYTGN